MPLSASTLETELRKFMDPSYGGFVAWPANDAAAAQAWADAMDIYTGAGLGILPQSVNGALAKAALVAGLSGMSAPGAAIPLFDTAFAAYALSIAGGMAPAFVAVPPPLLLSVTPPTLATILATGMGGASAAVQAATFAAWIHTWFTTGSATTSGGGPPAFWA